MSNWSYHTQHSLLDKAYQMVMRGWSVIPLRGMGDPTKPKAPALPSWKVYQSHKPRFEELQEWFIEKQYGALGVVLGRVSGIVVIDIDKPEIEIAFKHALSHLANTFTVRSGNRKLPHYYYTLSPDLDAPARTGQGIEFRSDGQYVVAPTTIIGESEWRIENPKIPHTLTKRDLSDIYAFLGLYTRKQSETPVKMPLKREISVPPNLPKPCTEERLTPDELRRWYVENARIYGRNNALFAGGCYARDLDWSYSQVAGVLVSAHITQAPNGDHPAETTAQRMDEARKTLDSVFKRPANIRKRHDKSAVGLSNVVRERLIQVKLDNTARVLDGLFLAGIRPNDVFTAYDAYALLAPMGIGRNAVYMALASQLENGQTVFGISPQGAGSIPLPPHPLHPNAIADKDKSTSPPQCLSGRETNAGKNRGRPIRQFVMPSNDSLCQRLAVRDMGSDPISRDDLKTPSVYRLALHKALIARAPKPYGRMWQANRLGVHIKTIRRYDKKAGISAIPQFNSQPLNWRNCDKVCPDSVEYGLFVTDETGKRHPAKKRMAHKLLAQKHRLTLHRQTSNYYHLPEISGDEKMRTAKMPPVQAHEVDKNASTSDYRQRWLHALERAMNGMNIQPSADSTPPIPISIAHKNAVARGISQPYPKCDTVSVGDSLSQYALPLDGQKQDKSKPSYQHPSTTDSTSFGTDKRACAERLYWALRRINPERSITKKLAKAWVCAYGIVAIDRHLEILKYKTDVRNPAGYLRTLLRVDAKQKGRN